MIIYFRCSKNDKVFYDKLFSNLEIGQNRKKTIIAWVEQQLTGDDPELVMTGLGRLSHSKVIVYSSLYGTVVQFLKPFSRENF